MHPLTFFLFAAGLATVWLMDWKALDNFVNLPDPHYENTLLQRTTVDYSFETDWITINVTSQKWLDGKYRCRGGWIAWLTAAVDQRVEATVHVAMDFLNFTESFHHQYRAYCGWSYMLRPFYEMNITRELDNPRFSDLASHVDPLAFNERYTNVSKLIIMLSGDELFQPDNSRNYFAQLEGTKYLRVIPNHDYGIYSGHGLMHEILPFYTFCKEERLSSYSLLGDNNGVTNSFTMFIP